jgi:ornithine cyclodeaminase/alanine dehydrogenase-like protein (mu-crystallin family)
MHTLLITRAQAHRLLDPASVLPALREAFVRHSLDRSSRPLRVRADLPGTEGTATLLFPGSVAGIPAYSVKVHAKFPSQDPAIRGVLCLHALDTGELLAIMDSTYLTAVRTGLAGALAAHVLARPDANTVAIVGAGVQGRHLLASLAALRDIRAIKVYDIVPAAAVAFSEEMSRRLEIAVDPASSVQQAVQDAGVVLMATWSREPLILPGMLVPGAHVTTLGPDEPGKVEVSAGVLAGSLLVTAELGEVLAGAHPGRTSAEQITVYGGVGLAFQDVVCAWHIYAAAKEQGVGDKIDFLA